MTSFYNGGRKYHGEHYDFLLRNVVLKPHAPLRVAWSQIETIRMAGTRGRGARGSETENTPTGCRLIFP
ncbi:MAG: hypothetical protein HQ511_14435 [Rhodospirillales bacterium]|nr:hypothetical protein [Rhodospirillales bacterium]